MRRAPLLRRWSPRLLSRWRPPRSSSRRSGGRACWTASPSRMWRAYLDLNALYRGRWGGVAHGEEYKRLVREEFEPRLERLLREARQRQYLRPRAVYGYYPARAEGDTLLVLDPADHSARGGAVRLPAPARWRAPLPGRLLRHRERRANRRRLPGGDDGRAAPPRRRSACRRRATTPRRTSCMG